VNAAVLQPLAPDSYRELVRRALAEDVGAGDVTTKATVDATHQARAVLLAKSRCVVAGLDGGGRGVSAARFGCRHSYRSRRRLAV
jgi:nicotinate-nucleotide pyrophosphorylase